MTAPHMTLPNGDTIPVGGYGRTRGGKMVGPMTHHPEHKFGKRWEWMAPKRTSDGEPAWYANGKMFLNGDDPDDIIAAWRDEPATPTLWRDMTPEEKGALLLAAHEGKVIEAWGGMYWLAHPPQWCDNAAYRIKPPEPKRETVQRYTRAKDGWNTSSARFSSDTHRLTLPIIDGTLPEGTYTNAEGETITVERLA